LRKKFVLTSDRIDINYFKPKQIVEYVLNNNSITKTGIFDMEKIKKIAPIHMLAETRGKAFALFMYIAIPLFLLVGLFMVYHSFINTGNTFDGVTGLLCFVFFGGGGLFMCKGGEYKPKKSFFFYRLTKEGLKKYIIWGAIIFIALILLMLIIDPSKVLKYGVGYGISAIITFYYMNKSIIVHEDVDYVANTQLSALMGLEVDEKINASYQNFDSSKSLDVQENSNIFLVSDKKIFFAYYNGNNWLTTIKKLGDIQKIGIMNYGNDGTSTYMKLVFADETEVGLRLSLYDKLTSNPNLFVKRFLDTLDAYLLGYSIVRNSRRRVSVDASPQIQQESSQSYNTAEEVGSSVTRQIDIDDTILNNLRDATPIESGRTLEL